ncbi:histidine phosphatase family protein [Pseudoxanthomonas sp.]|uniref:histidine phosphatase family protein n=1 Tax=Pseudoxanthomonas sp. TaxID=1871049 RepID=UPI00261DA9EB|nr:histidine phosphatase family protein [Pseudoxanthomonas sp.]WDS36165.1 MAG: histidine phosphatase family protein [Pseudoxanthomonas sp.]
MTLQRTRNGICRLLVAVSCLLLGACASLPPEAPAKQSATLTFILVPHADTMDDLLDDPPLSSAGQQRAQALNAMLAGRDLAAVYVDEFRATQDTVLPTLEARPGLTPQRYFSRGPLDETARQWLQRFDTGTVLVVGEPASIAPLADTLCDCRVRPLRADETDRLIRVDRVAAGSPHADDGRYGGQLP